MDKWKVNNALIDIYVLKHQEGNRFMNLNRINGEVTEYADYEPEKNI